MRQPSSRVSGVSAVMRPSAWLVLLTALLPSLAGTPAWGQQTDPPDRQAFRAARLLEDPQQSLDALTRVVRDYPTSRSAERARTAILDLLITQFPSRTQAIERQIDAVLKATPKDDRFGVADDIAVALVEHRVLLDRARRLAEQAVKGFVEARFLATARREAAAAKQPPPDEARLRRAFARTRAIILGTLGRVQLAQGRTDLARRTFLMARGLDPTLASAAEGLGALALAEGREQEAYDAFLRARLSGVLEPGHREAFDRLFAARHGGSLAGLDAALDEAYRTLYPNPVTVEGHAAAVADGRAPLLEVFTGAGCPPCAAADLAVDAVMERFPDVVVLMYHQHVPRPDPMTNPDTVARADAYGITGVPTLIVNGTARTTGGGPRDDAPRSYARLVTLVEQQRAVAPEARVALRLTHEGGVVRVHADAALLPQPEPAPPPRTDAPGAASASATTATVPGGTPGGAVGGVVGGAVGGTVGGAVGGAVGGVVLRLALAEAELRYSGENGIRFHPMVVRALAEVPFSGTALTVDRSFNVAGLTRSLTAYLDAFEQRNDRFGPMTFVERKAAIDPSRLRLVVFVQRTDDRRVLQSVVVTVPPPAEGWASAR